MNDAMKLSSRLINSLLSREDTDMFRDITLTKKEIGVILEGLALWDNAFRVESGQEWNGKEHEE